MSIGPVMLDLQGCHMQPEEREMLSHPAVGGVILFSRNFQSPEQLKALTQEIRAQREPPLLIAVDHEGGRVQRFRRGFIELPPGAWLGHRWEQGADTGRKAAQLMGWLMAAELRACGVDFSFAPVLDIDHGVSEVIGDRAFSADPLTVSHIGFAYRQGMAQAGMAATGKHFPGHGAVAADSHTDLPRDERTLDEIRRFDLVPFQRLIAEGLEAIMPAHVIYTQVDSLPAGFSTRWIQELLRGEMRFDGMVFSDDLNMQAAQVAGSFAERAEAALAAGCDMLLVCNNRDGALETLDTLGDRDDPVSRLRRVRMHGRGTVEPLQQDGRWHAALTEVQAYRNWAGIERPTLC